jgi:hypothetical protein
MAAKIYVLSQTSTGAVLAACTRGQYSDDVNATVLAQLVGTGLPVVLDPVVPPADPTVFVVPPSVLSVDAVPGDPSSLDPSGPLLSPLTYSVSRDSQGNFQSLNTGATITVNSATTAQLALGFTGMSLPSPNVANHSVPGWIALIDSNGTLTTKDIQVSATSTTDLTDGIASVVIAPGTYSMLVLVQGCRACSKYQTIA